MQQIPIEKTLDVEAVEHELSQLWQSTAGEVDLEATSAVLRARVANLLVYTSEESQFMETHDLVKDLTAVHPSRVIIMLGEREKSDRDIEMFVTTHCQTDKRSGAKRLCAEEVDLKARGIYVSELPSAALPLLVSDLSTFLWWRSSIQSDNQNLLTLLAAADRLIIDSVAFDEPAAALQQIHELFNRDDFEHIGISDLNWARLTLWRGLLADFYDVPSYHSYLNDIESVQIEFTAPEYAQEAIAPQALLMTGWLASRLNWTLDERETSAKETTSQRFSLKSSKGKQIKVLLNRAERTEFKPGRLVQVKLTASVDQEVSFTVRRSDDGQLIVAETRIAEEIQRGRTLPVRNRPNVQLLGREMEILCNDDVYEEAVAYATRLVGLLNPPDSSVG